MTSDPDQLATCPDCHQPIRRARVAHRPGAEWYDAFTPEPSIGGPWRLVDGAMERRGSGPRPGYHLHARRCLNLDLDAMIEHAEWTTPRSWQPWKDNDGNDE